VQKSEIVQAEFERIRARVWDEYEGDDRDEVLATLSERDRDIYVTRELEAELEDGGWYLVFANSDEGLIDPAIEAYERLALPGYAAHLREVLDSGYTDETAEDEGERLDEEFARLSGSERAREALLRRYLSTV
jgi:hypothetical protein